MSIEAVSLVLNHSKAHGRAKLVLIGIANHMGDQGSWPSIETLSKYANASERSIKRDIQELVELGELVVQYQAAPINSQYKTNLYWITISGVTDLVSGVTTQVSRGDSSGKSGVTRVGTQTIIKTIKELERATQIKTDYKPTEEMVAWATGLKPGIDVEAVTAVFIDYWLGVGKPMKDWDATWRNWIRREKVEKDSRRAVEASKSATRELLAESAEWAKRAAENPPEVCEHGRIKVVCRKCG